MHKETPITIEEQAIETQLQSNTQTTSNCLDTLPPVIMMHGFLGSGDTYAKQFMRFNINGYCYKRVLPFDWNSLGQQNNVPFLDAFIDSVLNATGANQVELVGHSAGGGLGYEYLNEVNRAMKVAHYVHIGSNPESGPAGPNGEVPTLNIYSTADEVVTGADISGATNVIQNDADHYQVATNEETFEAMFTFFTGSAPASSAIVPETNICVSGRVVTFGENQPGNGAEVKIYEISATTGERLDSIPEYSSTIGPSGHWGTLFADEGAYYEFMVIPADPNDRVVHYYYEPFIRSNPMVYLRTLPPASSTAGVLLASLPEDDNQAVIAVFSSSQAVINGRDQLHADGEELSTAQYTSSDQTTIALFLYDDGDQQTSGGPVGLFFLSPFMNGVDVFFPTTPAQSSEFVFNSRTLHAWNWRSETDGLNVVVFN